MKNLIDTLWNKEIPVLSERFRWTVSVMFVVSVIVFSAQFTFMWHNLTYLGPGLGEQASAEPIKQLIVERFNSEQRLYAIGFGVFLFAVIVFRAWVMFWSYFGYEKKFGEKYPQELFWLFMGMNAVGALSIPILLFFVGLLLYSIGWNFNDGWMFIDNVSSGTLAWIDHHIPTIVDMPAPLAILVIYFIAGFFHYWLHRLGHEFRALWLLFHRHHHMTPKLMQFCAGPVFFAFPLFIIFLLPYTFIFGSIVKLFHAETLYIEIFILNCFFMIPEIYGHSDVFYDQGKKSRFVKVMSFIFGNGIYHYLHHSANEEDCKILVGKNKGKNRKVNMVNMGGGFFFFWDIVFGTFTHLREQKPDVGLMGQPELHYNPIRIALSGFAQLIYELIHNKGIKTRFMILFGPSEYTPPVSRDFAIKPSQPA